MTRWQIIRQARAGNQDAIMQLIDAQLKNKKWAVDEVDVQLEDPKSAISTCTNKIGGIWTA